MKRLIALAMLCAFVFGMAANAAAADIKATGAYQFQFMWTDQDFSDDNDSSNFDVAQRLRTKFEFVANENLKGVLFTEVGITTWGNDENGAQVGTNILGDDDNDGGAVEVKAAYLDFNWPGTQQNIKVGHFGVALPAAVAGSAILDDELPTLMASGPITDNVSYLAAWSRLAKTGDIEGNIDALTVAVPVSFDGASVTPFVTYAYAGDEVNAGDGVDLLNYSGTNANSTGKEFDDAWWAGVAFEMTMFDPFIFKADLNYGQASADDEEFETAGWLFDMSLAYTGFDMVTPELFFAYTSGDDDNNDNGTWDDSANRMPTMSGGFQLGNFFFDQNQLVDDLCDGAPIMGWWALGLNLKDISFYEGLTHEFTLMYVQGNNDDDNIAFFSNPTEYLTEDDSFVEIDFNTNYKIYDELTAYVELGWISADWDNDWADSVDDEAYRVTTGLNYNF